VRGEINRAIAPEHATLLSPLFTLVGFFAAESKFQHLYSEFNLENVYYFNTSSLRRLALLEPCCSILVVGITTRREREELPSLCE
jgi:hypothetical protein